MASAAPGDGIVFVSYAHEDTARVEPLVGHLAAAGLNVWWDRAIPVGAAFRNVIQKMLDEAACVVVVWTTTSVDKDFVRSEANAGLRRGALMPVLLDAGARIPVGFTETHYLDLTTWDGLSTKPLLGLFESIRPVVARGPNRVGYTTLENDRSVINNSSRIVTELRDLTSQVRSINHLLALTAAPLQDVRAVLEEVGKTYRSVNTAIGRFIAPAFDSGAIDPKPFVELERGTLRTSIDQGRGHCGLILTHYGRYGGVRDWIRDKVSAPDLERLDTLFARLGTADGDLFRPLVDIGDMLTNESRVVANLLLGGQTDVARQRIKDGRTKLAPLEADLAGAMRDLQQLQSELGYAAPS
jgi:hypothetical protein